jgi:putative Holliday junction resolvase
MRRSDGRTDRRSAAPPEATVRPSDRPTVDLPHSGRLIAVDWGEKRIGIALSDPSQVLAQPLDTLERRAGRRFPMRAFRDLVDTHKPVGVVVGLPLEADGQDGESARAARELAAHIGTATGLPLALFDERMTTSRVRQAVAEMGGKTRGREAELDQLAATVLLQAFLDGRRA